VVKDDRTEPFVVMRLADFVAMVGASSGAHLAARGRRRFTGIALAIAGVLRQDLEMTTNSDKREILRATLETIATITRRDWECRTRQFHHPCDFPIGHCGVASEALVDTLMRAGYKGATYVCGYLPGTTQSHAWVECEGFILDITADQFPDQGPRVAVFVAEHSEWHDSMAASNP
jgi:hypothetical protein